MSDKTNEWLLQGEPWVEYRTRLDLHVLDVLSYFECAGGEKRFKQMLDLVQSKADENGRYVPESVWMPWRDWDFGQKKTPSRGLTFFVQRILCRIN